MELIFNDLSIHEQFSDIETFRDAIKRVMTIRRVAYQFDRELYCHRNVANAQVTSALTMQQVVQQALTRDQTRSLMQWLNRHGPFWEDVRRHSGNDWLECSGEIVTDTAVGEAAYCLFHGISRGLVSMDPSCWLTSPLSVNWRENGSGNAKSVGVCNYWNANKLEVALADVPVSLKSWKDLEMVARRRYPNLTFSSDSFRPLNGHPFGKSVAEYLLLRLNILHTFKNCCDPQGKRTPEGNEIYTNYFMGEKAWFSDSSDKEKDEFKAVLTFPHPEAPSESLFCPWHGKINYTPPLRIHFSWPIQMNKPLYVVYVGPKITRR